MPAQERVPDEGDIVWIDFGPPIGREQAGRRPALVVSPREYNSASSYVLVCPITRSPKPWPFKVPLLEVDRLEGFVITDQVKSIDRRLRVFRWHGSAPPETMTAVRTKLARLIGL